MKTSRVNYGGVQSEDCVITGGEFCKFYQKPLETHLKPGDIIEADPQNEFILSDLTEVEEEKSSEKFVSVSTQTDYRESEAQTDPWDPPFKTASSSNEPEILVLKDLTYGNGLPVSLLEIHHFLETRKNRDLKSALGPLTNEDAFEKTKQLISDQIRNDWNYKLSILNQKQVEKLGVMEDDVTNEIKKYSDRKDKILQNLWENKKDQMKKKNVVLRNKLRKDLRAVKSTFLNQKYGDSLERETRLEEELSSKSASQKEFSGGIDYMLSNYYLSNPAGLARIKNWLETKTDGLKTEIPLARVPKKTAREKLTESAYKDILALKRTKLPPLVYREDYVPEEVPSPSVKAEDVFEFIDFKEEKIDLITVWQKVLRGRAIQKQMLELIEHHKDGLSKALASVYPEFADS